VRVLVWAVGKGMWVLAASRSAGGPMEKARVLGGHIIDKAR
jgi:hypothetical protein